MTNHPHSISEPRSPEHQLLTDAAPDIELSAGFRSRVLVECAASHALARKVFLAKTLAVVLSAILACACVWILWHQPNEYSPKLEQPVPTNQSTFPSSSLSTGTMVNQPQDDRAALEAVEDAR